MSITKLKRKRATKAEMLKRAEDKLQKAGRLPNVKGPLLSQAVIQSKSPSPSLEQKPISHEAQEDKPITPLPLFTTNSEPSVKLVTPSAFEADPEKDKTLKEGLAEIVSEDIPRFLQNGLILTGWDKNCSVNPPSKGRSALWAEFALPMLRKYFPDFDADTMFWVLTVSLFTSMVEIKKTKGEGNAEAKD